MQPLTPPSVKTQPRSSVPYTPKTPFGKKLEKVTAVQSPPTQINPNSLLTPGPTPRHSSRKRKELGEAINLAGATTSQRTLFPPTPSTIGRGRSKNYPVSPIRKSTLDNDDISSLKTKRKLTFEIDEEEELETGNKTPGAQLITDKLINKWNDEVPSDLSDADDDEDEFISRKPLVNPFMTKSSEGPVIKRNLPKQTEITLINKKGEKIIRKLTEEESNYKPKNLFGTLVKEQQKINVYNDNEDL